MSLRSLSLSVVVMAVLLGPAGSSVAQVPDAIARPEYPLELVDRPLLMFAGMTSFDFGIDHAVVLSTTVDEMGNKTTRRVGVAVPALLARHSFGAIEISAATDVAPGGDDYAVGGSIRLGALPGILSLVLLYATEEDLILEIDDEQGHAFEQRLSYAYKAFLAPKRFSIGASASVQSFERSRTPTMGMPVTETGASISVGVGPQLQITRRLAVYGAASVNVPVYGDEDAATTLFAHVSVLVALRHWDFYGRFGMQDLTDTRRPLVAYGAVYRFGQ